MTMMKDTGLAVVRKDPSVIIDAVVKFRQVGRRDLVEGRMKYPQIVWPRHELTYLLHEMTVLSLKAIADVLGGRDTKTVMNSLSQVTKRCAEDPSFLESFAKLTQFVRAYQPEPVPHENAAMSLARRLLDAGPDAQEKDVKRLALAMLTTASVLYSQNLTDAEARHAALQIIANTEAD